MSYTINAKDIDMGPKPAIDGDVASQIAVDVCLGTPPAKSRVKYGPEELAFRAKVQADWDKYHEAHPGVMMDIPSD